MIMSKFSDFWISECVNDLRMNQDVIKKILGKFAKKNNLLSKKFLEHFYFFNLQNNIRNRFPMSPGNTFFRRFFFEIKKPVGGLLNITSLKVPRPALTIITKKPRFFCRIVKIKISERLLGVGSSAFDMFQMTFQFVRIRGISIIWTLFPYDFLYTPSKLFFKVMFLIENLCFWLKTYVLDRGFSITKPFCLSKLCAQNFRKVLSVPNSFISEVFCDWGHPKGYH